MGRIFKVEDLTDADLENIAADAVDIEMFDYIHAMTGSMLKTMAKPGANRLRSLLWLSKVEAKRLLDETRDAVARP